MAVVTCKVTAAWHLSKSITSTRAILENKKNKMSCVQGVSESRAPRVLICASGSVATVKIPEIVALCSEFAEVRVVCTKSAVHFLNMAHSYNADTWAAFQARRHCALVYTDQDEWDAYAKVGVDPVVHIELRKWADVMVIAPTSANTLAKLAQGLSDNLLTSIARAWDPSKPLLVAPAMNTHMWDHPLTAMHLNSLTNLGVTTIQPVSKLLACGDKGTGALATVPTIIEAIRSAVATSLGLDKSDTIYSLSALPKPSNNACEATCSPVPALNQLARIKQVLADGAYLQQDDTLGQIDTRVITSKDTATKVVLGVALVSVRKTEEEGETRVLRVHALAVVSSKRGNGIASRVLVPAIIAQAQSEKCERIELLSETPTELPKVWNWNTQESKFIRSNSCNPLFK